MLVARRQLDQSCRSAVHRHIGYAGSNARDVQMNYEYRGFGVPVRQFMSHHQGMSLVAYAARQRLLRAPDRFSQGFGRG